MVAEHITNLPCDKQSGRRGRTQMLVVHSAETPLESGYAPSVSRNWLNKWYQANGALIEASINGFFGPETTVRAVDKDYAAWHASWANNLSVGYEFTGYAALTRDDWLTAEGTNMLDRAGRELALDAKRYGIPLRWLTTSEVNQIANGNTSIKGLATHRQIDPVSRTDPGDGFPYDVLLANIKRYSGDTSNPSEEDDVPLTDADIERILKFPIPRSDKKGNTSLWSLVSYMPADVAGLADKVKDINTSSGPVSVRQMLVNAAYAAQDAKAQTADIQLDGSSVSLRQFVATGTRTIQGLEPIIVETNQLVKADNVDIDDLPVVE